MKFLLTLFFVAYTIVSFSQTPPILWQQNIGGSGSDGLGRLDIPGSTDYFLLGTSDSNISGDKTENSRGFNDIWIVKMDANNTILWDKTIGGDGPDILTDSKIYNNQLFILTQSNSSISGEKTIAPFSNSQFDLWLLCLDLSGNLIWQNQYGGDSTDESGKMLILPSGNILITSSSNSGISGNKTSSNVGDYDIWTLKVNSLNGNIITQNTIGSALEDKSKFPIFLNNKYFILSRSRTGVSGNKTDIGFGQFDEWLIEIDTSLNIISDKCFGGTDNEWFSGSFNFINGFYYLMSSSSSPISGNKSAPYFGSFDAFQRPDYWLIKMDANFNIIWDKTYGGNVDDNGGSVYPLSNNRLLITGSSETNINGNKTSPKYGYADAWFLIIDTTGNIIAQETYGGSLNDYIGASPTITNGVFYLSGGSESSISGIKTVPTNGGYDAWLMEIDASGFLNTEKIEGVNTTISVYPNPSNGKINFKFSDLEEDVIVTFFGSDGKVILSNGISSKTAVKSFRLSHSNQLVIYQITGKTINYTGKIIIN